MLEGERLILRVPTKEDEIKLLEMVYEFINNSEKSIPGSSNIESCESYDEWLNNLKKNSNIDTLPEGRVLSNTFISVRKEDNKIIGFVNLRYELNDYLLKFGGHIGDSIRPSERNKGYATEQLQICLKHCNDLGIKEVLLTCKDWNAASRQTIIKCGGKYENTKTDKDGNNLERYWIRS